VKIRAPAKINVSLHVVGVRRDGYHLVDTIMLPVSLYDDLTIHKNRGGTGRRKQNRLTVTCDDPSVPGGKKNLAYKAAELLLSEAEIDASVDIRIRKRIPVGAGLGGGSTDAAATLLGLNRLFSLGYTSRRLEKLALSLGADVPFFIRGGPARARGIGEQLTGLRGVRRFWLVILYPGFAVSTAWVYKNLRHKSTRCIANTSMAFPLRSLANLRKLLVNDLEAVTLDRYPRIRLLKQRLVDEGAVGALMSGSGSSVFGVFNSRRSAEHAFRRLRNEEELEAFLVRVLS
jgi:4-diphosphocytidyl-2-C-methyl-D-erythritol kinase